MNRNIILFSLLLLTPLFLQCGKLKLNPNAFYRSDFPISLNSYWEYERIDSVSLGKDTLRMTIVEKNITLYETKNLWKLLWQTPSGVPIDSSYIKFQQGNILFYEDRIVHISRRAQYNFPFKQDTEWDLGNNVGTYTVKDAQFDSSILGQDYGNAYYIERNWLLEPGDLVLEHILMVKGIGITRRSIERLPFSYQVFQLIDYHIE